MLTAILVLLVVQLLFSLVPAHSGHHSHLSRSHANLHLRRPSLDKRTTTTSFSSFSLVAAGQGSEDYGSFVLGSQTRTLTLVSPAALSTSTATPKCPGSNGNTLATPEESFQILCNVDVPGQNIAPFIKAGSFESCVSSCDEYNNDTQKEITCVGIIFVPSRSGQGYADDCYLKSAWTGAFVASASLVAAIPATSSLNVSTTPVGTIQHTSIAASLTYFSSPSTSVTLSENPTKYASATAIVVPSVKYATPLGASQNNPTTTYVNQSSIEPIALTSNLLRADADMDLINDYPISPDTGCIAEESSYAINSLSQTPILSRDGGKGGNLNGQNIFIFCDTTTYSTPNSTHEGEFLGMVSSSVAIDLGMNALNGQALILQDGIGQWSDDVGRLRGFAPMTTGEQGYNYNMSGNGYRFAIWPGSSLIPLNTTSGLIYANIIFDVVDMSSQAAAFNSLGNTLLTVTTNNWGPVGTRLVKQMFTQEEASWGSLGGIRSWGSTGPGGNDGRLYVFSAAANGILSGRVDVESFADKTKYEYWDGEVWSSSMPTNSSTASLISEQVMDFDIFYSPRHLTFIMIYLTKYADNTFYYRYLNSTEPVLPGYAGGNSSSDYVEQIVDGPWSDENELYQADKPPAGNYIYDGSFHAGYFGVDDIINGGDKMLLSWTQHTGQDGGSSQTGYAHMTVVLTFA